MSSQVIWLRQDAAQELPSFQLFTGIEPFNHRLISYETVKEASVAPEAITVRQ